MDTISRENNSMMPVFGIIVGVVALVLGGVALVQASKASKAVAQNQPKIDKIDGLSDQIASAAAAADSNKQYMQQFQNSTQKAFDTVASNINGLQAAVTTLESSAKRSGATGKKGRASTAVAGPGEYIVKHGDFGTKIARSQGVSLADLKAVNPGVNWNKLAVGQKLKLPEKK